MKFTRSTWITIFFTLFLVAVVVLGSMYNSANNGHKLAQKNLDTARLLQTALNKAKTGLSAPMAQADADVAAWNDKITLLQTALGQASLSLKQTQSKFPTSAQTIEYNETLMGLAKSSNLTMQLLVATEPAEWDLSTSAFTFYTNVFTIEVTGKVSNILDFVDKVATNGAFQTGALTPVTFTIPQPLSQAVKDKMKAAIRVELVAQAGANLTAEQRVGIIEQAILLLLEEQSRGLTVEQMTQQIREIITVELGSGVADRLATDIANAIEQNVADLLIDTVAQIYSEYIGQLIVNGQQDLIPQFLGKLGAEITSSLGDKIDSALPGEIKTIIIGKLNSLVYDKINALVSDTSVDAVLAAQVTAAEMPAAELTVTVYSYKGD